MKKALASIMLALLFLPHVFAQKKPNIIFILTDDLGYGDVGVLFQNQRKATKSGPFHITPAIDRMAATGATLRNMYCNAPVCAPSRASLMTGMHQGNAHIRDNQFDKALEDNHTIATVLKHGGYETWAIGKWGLQGAKNKQKPNWPAHPLKRGFDHFYGYMRHADGHEHYPAEGLYRSKKEVYDNYNEVSDGLQNCYTADLWTARAKKQIIDHVNTDGNEKPFFLYLAYDTPHAVLELPAAAYPQGGGLKGGLQWIGKKGNMISSSNGRPDSYYYPDYASATYDDDHNPATAEKPWPDTYKRYASSVRRIDDGIGDIFQLLKDLKLDENTIVVFSSDNGPSIESYLPENQVPYSPVFFGSYGPFDGIKRDVWEGGVHMPVLARWPGHIPGNSKVDTPSMLSDWLATFADAAGVPIPARTDGVSLLPALTGNGKQPESQVYVEYFQNGKTPGFVEFEASRRNRQRNQMQFVRTGDFVGVRYDISSAGDDFEIYNVKTDPKQKNNLAKEATMAQMQAKMKAMALQMHRADTGAKRPYDIAPIPAELIKRKLSVGISYASFAGEFPWVASGAGILPHKKGTVKGLPLNSPDAGASLVCYSAYVKIPSDGAYDFHFQTSGKAIVRLQGTVLFDADMGQRDHAPMSSKVYLKAGYHPVKIYTDYTGSGASPKLDLSWNDTSGKTYKELFN